MEKKGQEKLLRLVRICKNHGLDSSSAGQGVSFGITFKVLLICAQHYKYPDTPF